MNQKERKAARGLQIVSVCCCLCLLAVGAGVTYRTLDRDKTEVSEPLQKEQPVTAVQSKTIEIAQLEEQKEPEETKKTETQPTAQPVKPAKKNEQPVFASVFASPLEGETKVVLAYSTDHAIYDPTLEQYRTNASVSLSAKKGTEVKAAADGVVKEVKKDAQAGNTVTIAHGENWLTTYGQLAETVAVREGESVKQGQKIGAVAAPTKYGVALGDHLDFAMEQNGEPQNPTEKIRTAE